MYLALNPEKKLRDVEKEWAKLCNGGKAELDGKEIPEGSKMKAVEVSKVFSKFERGRANKWQLLRNRRTVVGDRITLSMPRLPALTRSEIRGGEN